MLTTAHNIAWKLALVLKGQSSDPDKVLESYSAEVRVFYTPVLTLANPYNWADNCSDSVFDTCGTGCQILVVMVNLYAFFDHREPSIRPESVYPTPLSGTVSDIELMSVIIVSETNCRWNLIYSQNNHGEAWNNVS